MFYLNSTFFNSMFSVRQPVFAMQLENIERENFNRSPTAKYQISQYFLIKILHYTVISSAGTNYLRNVLTYNCSGSINSICLGVQL